MFFFIYNKFTLKFKIFVKKKKILFFKFLNGIISWNQINLTTKFLINLSIIQRIWNQNNQQWKGFNLARYRIILINTFWSIFYKNYKNFSEKKKKSFMINALFLEKSLM